MTLQHIFQDWKANHRNPKGRIILLAFRLAQVIRKLPLPLLLIFFPYLIFYRVVVEWILSVELPWNLTVGEGLCINHGHALVVHDHTIIGNHCRLRHCTTIGVAHTNIDYQNTGAPVIEDYVDIGSNVCIIGDIRIGHHAVIGAGSVVVKDVPAYAVVVGNPARVIRIQTPSNS